MRVSHSFSHSAKRQWQVFESRHKGKLCCSKYIWSIIYKVKIDIGKKVELKVDYFFMVLIIFLWWFCLVEVANEDINISQTMAGIEENVNRIKKQFYTTILKWKTTTEQKLYICHYSFLLF